MCIKCVPGIKEHTLHPRELAHMLRNGRNRSALFAVCQVIVMRMRNSAVKAQVEFANCDISFMRCKNV